MDLCRDSGLLSTLKWPLI